MDPKFLRITALEPSQINRFLDRRRWSRVFDFDMQFDELFQQILLKANEFVPSEAGSILLDDPRTKDRDQPAEKMVFIACFGEKGSEILGKSIDSNVGIAGKTYLTGKPYKTNPQNDDPQPFRQIDSEIGYTTHSIVSVPIIIEKSVCGVLELINRLGGSYYTDRELELLQIFAGYISTSIQNALEAKRSKELSKMDDLTGLYNDRYFHYVLQQELINVGTTHNDISLLFIDLDRFKMVNDKYGHLAGSRTLHEVGRLLKRVVKQKRATLARYGGDEFVCVLPDLSLKQAREVAERIRQAVANKIFLKRKSDKSPALSIKGVITASIGIASFRQHLKEPGGIQDLHNQLVFLADHAMYVAKEKGKNRVVCADLNLYKDHPVIKGRSAARAHQQKKTTDPKK